jgi:glycosyltransferase involved in cell wall biosynthesis
MGAGRAIVSTPYAYAVELLANGRGVLVPTASTTGLSAALDAILGDRLLREGIGRRAHEYSRRMVWPAVAEEYRRVFERVTAVYPVARQPELVVAARA